MAHSPLSLCCEPPRTSRVVRSPRAQNRYSPMDVKPSSRKGKSLVHRMSSGSDDDEPKKPRKRREAVSLACYFCRKRKIACRQPPEGSPDRTCKSVFPSLDCPRQFHSFLVLGDLTRFASFFSQCKARGMECEYPTESRRGARRGSAAHKHPH